MPLMYPGKWADEAPCKEHPNDFFADEPPYVDEVAVARAKASCARCPSIAACEAHVMRDPWVLGIYAGRTGPERRKLARRTSALKRQFGGCPRCLVRTPTVAAGPGRLECLECGHRWPPL